MPARYVLAFLMLQPALAFAEDAPGPRYSISPALDGYVRLDVNSGAMLYCRSYETAIRCEEVGVDGAIARADEAEMDDLRNRIGSLERKVAVLERDQIRLPDGKDISQTLDTMDKVMRRFVESMQLTEKDMQK